MKWRRVICFKRIQFKGAISARGEGFSATRMLTPVPAVPAPPGGMSARGGSVVSAVRHTVVVDSGSAFGVKVKVCCSLCH